MKTHFTKMQGAGNDFVVLDCTRSAFHLNADQIRFLGDRHMGVGADQILVVEKASRPDTDFRYRIFNQDGGEVEQCGNGARCFAKFVFEKGLTDKRSIRVETMKGVIEPRLCDDGRVRVNMGLPRFEPEELPFLCQGVSHLSRGTDTLWEVRAGGQDCWVSLVSMGNPHAVMVVGDVDEARVSEIGPDLENSPLFPRRVNVGFLQPLSRSSARLRVWERGAGETLACGTGACAAAVAGMRRGLFDSAVEIQARGGRLLIEWQAADGEPRPVYLTGPAAIVFEGEVDIPEAGLPAKGANHV